MIMQTRARDIAQDVIGRVAFIVAGSRNPEPGRSSIVLLLDAYCKMSRLAG